MNILVALDFSDASAPILQQAVNLAKGVKEAHIYLLHVAAPEPDFVGYDVGPKYIRDARADELKEEHTKLATYRKQVEAAGMECTPLLIAGQSSHVILSKAEELDVAYIVIGSHGRSALFEALLGSVTQSVLRDSKVPVMVIPMEVSS